MSIKFERVLQTVEPWLSLPYWDYTIDVEKIDANYDGNFTQYWFELDVSHNRTDSNTSTPWKPCMHGERARYLWIRGDP